jgi:hypothetical protein
VTTSRAFDEGAENSPEARVVEIGHLILADDRIRDAEWEGISLVAIVGGGSSQLSAYRYDAAGGATPSTPRNFDLIDRFEDLQRAMAAYEPRAWKSCLVRIRKPDLKMQVDFEYDDALRWKVNPGNLETLVGDLRPG